MRQSVRAPAAKSIEITTAMHRDTKIKHELKQRLIDAEVEVASSVASSRTDPCLLFLSRTRRGSKDPNVSPYGLMDLFLSPKSHRPTVISEQTVAVKSSVPFCEIPINTYWILGEINAAANSSSPISPASHSSNTAWRRHCVCKLTTLDILIS